MYLHLLYVVFIVHIIAFLGLYILVKDRLSRDFLLKVKLVASEILRFKQTYVLSIEQLG
jgi:hypothetical protein